MSDSTSHVTGTTRVKRGMAEMLKGGVIMDVVTPDQAKIAEDAGAVAVMALERVPADIRAQGGVARMSDPDMIEGIIDAVTIPVMAKARIGHFAEAQVIQSLGVDYIDESEVLTPADYSNHIDKWQFTVPFVCGATNLGEALRRITEGAAMIRSKGEAGTGDVSNAVTHMRRILGEIRALAARSEDELYVAAKELQAPYDLVVEVAKAGRLPVVLFTVSSWARESSSQASPRSVRRPSSRQPGTSTTPMSWPRCHVGWARQWSASMSPTSRSTIVSKIEAGDGVRQGPLRAHHRCPLPSG